MRIVESSSHAFNMKLCQECTARTTVKNPAFAETCAECWQSYVNDVPLVVNESSGQMRPGLNFMGRVSLCTSIGHSGLNFYQPLIITCPSGLHRGPAVGCAIREAVSMFRTPNGPGPSSQ